MSDPLKTLEALAGSQIEKRQRQANEHRAKFPLAAAFIDKVREVFGEAKLIHASENGNEIGRHDETGWVCITAWQAERLAQVDAGIQPRAPRGRKAA